MSGSCDAPSVSLSLIAAVNTLLILWLRLAAAAAAAAAAAGLLEEEDVLLLPGLLPVPLLGWLRSLMVLFSVVVVLHV